MNSLRGTMPLSWLKADPGLQIRTATDDDYCDDLAAKLKADDDFDLPEVTVFEDADGVVWLADGFHRHEAYRLAGRERMPVKVKKGSRDDALTFALGANEAHGLRRSPADRRRAVQQALQHPVIGQKPLREIARLCGGVSWELVKRVQEELQGVRPVADGSSRFRAKPPAGASAEAAGDGGASFEESIAAGPFACTDCPRSFFRQLWHCPSCGRHRLPEQEACETCEGARPMPADWYSQATAAAPVDRFRDRSPARRPDPAEAPAAAATCPTPSDQLPRIGPPEPITEEVCDVLGRPVPDGLIEVFKRLTPFRSIIQRLGAIKSELAELKSFGVGTDHLRTHEIHADLDNAQKAVRFAAPYAVCPKCQGTRCKGCLCEGRGWIREDQFHRLPTEVQTECKAFRQAS